MAQIIADRVKETSTSTGTGAFTLAGAMTGFKTFSSVCANSDTVYYAIQGVDGTGSPTAEWEVGFGSWGTGGVLTRTTVYSSSNANALVNFSSGDKQVWIDAPASWLTKVDASSVTDFYTSGTYTVPSTATFVEVHAYGAGGGGASGRRGAAGALRTGGGGGGGGALHVRKLKASDLTPTVLVTVGAGGVGGVATTVNDTNGSFGAVGGNSTFGSYVTGYGGGGGRAGSNAAMNGGGGGGVAGAGISGGQGGAPRLAVAANTSQHFGGGDGNTPSSSGKDSTYGGGGGGTVDAINTLAGTSVFAGGGGAGGGGISSANASIPCVAAGGTYGISLPSTTNQGMINGASGSDFNGGHGGASVVLQSTLQFQQIAYGDSKFVGVGAVGTESFFSTSADGTTGWNMSPIPVGTFIVSNVLYGASKWVFYNTTQIYTSVDLVTFSVATSPSGVVMNHIAYSGGLYIAVGTAGAISTSPDLVTWTPRTSGVSANLFAATHNGTKWIVVGQNGVTLTSTDGISWTLVTISGTPFLFSVAANGTTVVAHSNTSPFAHYSTDSGATWNSAATVVANGGSGTGNKGLIYSNGKFVLIGTAASTVYTSTDGNTWTLQADGTTDSYIGLAGNGTTYVIGSNTVNSNVGISSPDGVTWTPRTFTDSRTITAGGNGGNGGIVAGGGGGSASLNGHNSGAGGNGGNGFVRVYAW